jgi:hypothetical protein
LLTAASRAKRIYGVRGSVGGHHAASGGSRAFHIPHVSRSAGDYWSPCVHTERSRCSKATGPPPVMAPLPPSGATGSYSSPTVPYVPPGNPGGGGGGGGCPPHCFDEGYYQIQAAYRIAAAVGSWEDQKGRLLGLGDYYWSAKDQQKRIEAAFRILAASWVAGVLDRSNIQRDVLIEQARTELRELMATAVDIVVGQMKADIATLVPYFWNVWASEQRTKLLKTEQEVVQAGTLAKQEIKSEGSIRALRSQMGSAVHYTPGPAVRQLQEIDRTKTWRNQ